MTSGSDAEIEADEVIDTFDELARQNHELRAQNERLRHWAQLMAQHAQDTETDLLAEIERLRAAHQAHISDKWCAICDPDMAASAEAGS